MHKQLWSHSIIERLTSLSPGAQVREQLWAQQQEAKVLRDKAEGQRKALEERRADISGFKVGDVAPRWDLKCRWPRR